MLAPFSFLRGGLFFLAALGSIVSAAEKLPGYVVGKLDDGSTIVCLNTSAPYGKPMPPIPTGLRDREGQMIIPFGIYNGISQFTGSRTLLQVRKRPTTKGSPDSIGLYDLAQRREVLPCGPYSTITHLQGTIYRVGIGQPDNAGGAALNGLFDIATGQEVQPCTAWRITVHPGKVAILDYRKEATAIVGMDGKDIEPHRYSQVDYKAGLPVLRVAIGDGAARRWGYISPSGKALTPLHYTWAREFSEGCAVAVRDEKFTLLDATGRELLPPTYAYITPFKDGFAAFSSGGPFLNHGEGYQGSGWGFLSAKGEVLGTLRFDDVGRDGTLTRRDGPVARREGKVPVLHAGRWILIDPRQSSDQALAAAAPVAYEAHQAKINTTPNAPVAWGYRAPGGPLVLAPQWAHAETFVGGFGIVGQYVTGKDAKGKAITLLRVGLIDPTGKIVLEPRYERLAYLKDTLFAFGEYAPGMNGMRYGMLDVSTQQIVAPARFEALQAVHGLIRFTERGKFGIIDSTGKIVQPAIYTQLGQFIDGIATAKGDSGAYWVDQDFKPLTNKRYLGVAEFRNGRGIAWTRLDKWGRAAGNIVVDREGNVLATLPDSTEPPVATKTYVTVKCTACNGNGGRYQTVTTTDSTYVGTLPNGYSAPGSSNIRTYNVQKSERVGNCFTCNGTGTVRR